MKGLDENYTPLSHVNGLIQNLKKEMSSISPQIDLKTLKNPLKLIFQILLQKSSFKNLKRQQKMALLQVKANFARSLTDLREKSISFLKANEKIQELNQELKIRKIIQKRLIEKIIENKTNFIKNDQGKNKHKNDQEKINNEIENSPKKETKEFKILKKIKKCKKILLLKKKCNIFKKEMELFNFFHAKEIEDYIEIDNNHKYDEHIISSLYKTLEMVTSFILMTKKNRKYMPTDFMTSQIIQNKSLPEKDSLILTNFLREFKNFCGLVFNKIENEQNKIIEIEKDDKSHNQNFNENKIMIDVGILADDIGKLNDELENSNSIKLETLKDQTDKENGLIEEIKILKKENKDLTKKNYRLFKLTKANTKNFRSKSSKLKRK